MNGRLFGGHSSQRHISEAGIKNTFICKFQKEPNKKSFSLQWLMVFLSLPAFSLARPLTWKECVKTASLNNLDLLVAEQSVKSAEDLHAASLGQFLPQINLNASLSRSGSDPGLLAFVNDPSYKGYSSLSLSAQENIFSGFRDFASVDQSNAQLDSARSELAEAKSQLSNDLKSAFYQLLFSQKQIGLLRVIAERQKSNMQLVGMNFKGGTDNKGSYLQAQASSQQSEYEVNQAERALRVAQRQLAHVLGKNLLESIEVEGDFGVPPAPANPDFITLTVQTPAHRLALAQVRLSEGQWLSSRSTFFPTLSANASLSRQDWDTSASTPAWSAGLNLSFPLFTGGRDLFNFKSAEEAKTRSEESLRNTDLKTESRLEASFASYQNALESVKVQEGFLKAAQTREEIAKAEYLNGLLSFQNWDLIESTLTSQQKAELSSFLSVKLAEAEWELAQGKGVIPRKETLEPVTTLCRRGI